jgi:hypothetical protein
MRANTLTAERRTQNYQADAQLTSERSPPLRTAFLKEYRSNAMETFPGSVCDFVADVGVRVGQRNGLNTSK